MRDQSLVERTVRAANHARAALLAGYTTYRDLGTEALGNADANLRDCINRGLIPGPRLFVATEALASSGSYEIRVENKVGLGLTVPRAADACDGVSGVRAAVRRRVGDGADVIKFYADYRRKVMRWPNDIESGDGPGNRILFPPDNKKARNPAVPLFSQEEMNAIVAEAALAQLPVAAHAGETRAALMAAMAGVSTIEHIFEDTDGLLDRLFEEMKERGTVWVPTLATAEIATTDEIYRWCKAAVKKAHDQGVLLAAGGDTGTFNHGLNAREMEIMVESGIPVEDALVAGTIRGWAACGKDQCGFRFGWFEEGNRADIIALETDPREDARALRKVSFVMKDGRVWKRDGMPVDMISVPQWPAEEEDLSRDGSSSQGWFEVPS
jgi:imidazolonepropionase-like amidohydrolase